MKMRRKVIQMKSSAKSKIIILISLGILFVLSPIINNSLNFNALNSINNLNDVNLTPSKISGRIHIDNNWTDAKAAGICTGDGTYSDPYVIEDLVIDGGGSGSCIWIENSIVYFKIQNCRLYNAIHSSYAAGINLWNASNGYVIDNQANDNGYIGINLIISNNNTILRNDACSQGIGIALQMSHNNLIKGNIFNKNSADASLASVGSDNNTILENSLNFNRRGIMLWFSSDNNVSRNFLNFNYNGIWIYEGCRRNTIYLNCLNNNSLTAFDEGGWSHWDNGSIGNYWSDYTGVDSDENGIGDTPYNITRSMYNSAVTNQDNFPLMECPLPVPVQGDMEDPIKSNAPSDFTVEYGYTGQSLSWTATDANPDTYWIELIGIAIVVASTPWSNNTPVVYNIPDGFSVGSYIYTVTFTDDYGNFITDSVDFTVVEDTTNPVITVSPNNFTVEVGYTEQSLSWTATDLNPDNYTIELQGTGIVAGPTEWTIGNAINYSIPNGFSPGVYIYTVNFTDDFGNSISNKVTVTIKAISGGAIPFELIIIALVIGGGGVIGVATLLLIIRKRKRIE